MSITSESLKPGNHDLIAGITGGMKGRRRPQGPLGGSRLRRAGNKKPAAHSLYYSHVVQEAHECQRRNHKP